MIAAAVALWISIEHPTPTLQKLACVLLMMVMVIYVRVVLLVVFRRGTVTWGRVQGGVAAYLLIGLAWTSAYRLMEGAAWIVSLYDCANRYERTEREAAAHEF